nr:hypothetical protein [uncultured Flavobacterium sp.]
MKEKKGLNFFLLIIVMLMGSKLFNHFDFQNFKFEKPMLDMVYLLSFLMALFIVLKDYFKCPQK